MRIKILGLAAAACVALLGVCVAKTEDQSTCRAKFIVSLKPSEAPKGSKGQAIQMPNLDFSGSLYWSEPQMRIDLTQPAMGETMRLQLNVESGAAVMLYPETLNGYSGNLSDFDSGGYFKHFSDLLESGGVPKPEGWKSEAGGKETLGGKTCTKRTLTSPKGKKITWWNDQDGNPVRMKTSNPGMQVQVDFSEFKFGAEVPASTFKYSKDIVIIPYSGSGLPKSQGS